MFEDWDKLDIQGRVERAVYEITHYGLNYQRFRYLCGDEHADDVYYGDGYNLFEEPADNFTFGYFLDLYDTETDPMRKQLMFVYISSFLTGTWNYEEHAVPYTTHYYPHFDYFKAENLPRCAVDVVDFEANGVYINDVDGTRFYTVQFKEENCAVKIVGGTLVTEWLFRTVKIL